jgi:SAM-dependent methyltransferase
MDENGVQQDRLYDDPDLVQFYDLENEGGVDFDACLSFAMDARSVLDLGCGTGQLAAALGKDRRVTGVDPAAAMLDIARQRPGGKGVDWVQADARTVRLGRTFDLVLLTGHAFQVFLTPQDQAAVLRTIACHLAPGGRFIFDTRNPAAEEWREWTPEGSRHWLEHPRLGRIEAWNDFERDPATGIVTYGSHYRTAGSGRTLSASSMIAFPSRGSVAKGIEEAGLVVDKWLGAWTGEAFGPSMPEIIPIGQLR